MSTTGEQPHYPDLRPKLTVIGVGGAGCNAVNNMIATGLSGVVFMVANTDAQALAASSADHRIQLGAELTEGLGAGSRPEIGEAAAEEAIEDIREQIKGSHMVFIAAGMGGGTGTGAASVIARAARELGILTVGVVTKPFLFEGARRMRIAEAGVAELRNYVDTLIVIPNQNLFRIASEKTTFSEAFVMADQVLYSGVACIVDLILKEGLINLDFADVRTVMTGMGTAMMGTGEATGERRATVAAEEAISNPLLDDVSLRGAKGLLLSITGGPDLTLYEVDEAASRVRMEVDPEANIIVGATYDPELGERIRVSIVASGMSRAGEAERAPPAPAETWVRGTKAAAAADARSQQANGARAPATGGGFIPDPRDYRGGAHDLQQRLTEALQHAPPGPPQGVPVPRAAQVAPDSARGRGGDPWRGPGNVMIEAGPPQLQGATPPPLPQGHRPPHDQGAFAPQPPSEVRRQASRRLPEAGEYPPALPHGYRPAPGAYGGDIPRHAPPSEHYPPQHAEPRRRLGLFERITGRVRGAGDSDTRQPDSHDPYAKNISAAQAAGGEPEGYANYAQAVDPHTHEGQDAEIPVFFRERRR
ncbi:cell division protein FtsZ [Hyphomicrobium sp.]|uniref:cell division protein FtsZ n=1 Tax=Hyphomicrobium sp. TaxID=82 RepID=UPI0025C4786D|nr:cell division protein FtsZ [Hyphomicrobium sp.]MCC7252110.1 cell division protein FtsZ [Hyphomicrobium sp.]